MLLKHLGVWGGERERGSQSMFRQRCPLSRLRGKETKSGAAGQSLSRLRRKRTISGTEAVSSVQGRLGRVTN